MNEQVPIQFAPMEGLTDYIYRNIHRAAFPGVSRYWTPFLSPTQNGCFSAKEMRDILPEHNRGVDLVPQLLTKNASDFLWAAEALAELGYTEVNLNLGCPSGTVTAKKKGSGFLAEPEALERFLDAVFAASPIAVSVKTRVGYTEPDEIVPLMDIFNRYPLRSLTVHPRTRQQFYSGELHSTAFAYAGEHAKCPVCYNGEIHSKDDIASVIARFPGIASVMVGRGLVENPAMLRETPLRLAEFYPFHCALSEAYASAFGSLQNAMGRMKEIWLYQIRNFPNADKFERELRKAARWVDFSALVHRLCAEGERMEKSLSNA